MDAINYLEKQSAESQRFALKYAREALAIQPSNKRLADALLLLERKDYHAALMNLTVVALWWNIQNSETLYMDGGHFVTLAIEYAAAASAEARAARTLQRVGEAA